MQAIQFLLSLKISQQSFENSNMSRIVSVVLTLLSLGFQVAIINNAGQALSSSSYPFSFEPHHSLTLIAANAFFWTELILFAANAATIASRKIYNKVFSIQENLEQFTFIQALRNNKQAKNFEATHNQFWNKVDEFIPGLRLR